MLRLSGYSFASPESVTGRSEDQGRRELRGKRSRIDPDECRVFGSPSILKKFPSSIVVKRTPTVVGSFALCFFVGMRLCILHANCTGLLLVLETHWGMLLDLTSTCIVKSFVWDKCLIR